MTKVLLIVGSVRPGRIGLPVAEWVRSVVAADARFELDFADLAEIRLPFMDEPVHPLKRQYEQPHTIAWSRRVDAADAVIIVTPEYNHSYSPVLKNALDYLNQEWRHKPVGSVSYGGVSGGTRGAISLDPVLVGLGMVKTTTSVEINFVARHVEDDVFTPDEKHEGTLATMLDQLDALAGALKTLR